MLLGQFAAAAPAAGIRLSVACLSTLEGNPAATPLEALGISPVNLEAAGRPTLGAVAKVRRHIAAAAPDIVHTHLGTADWLGGIAARSLGIPAVTSIHTALWPDDRKTDLKRRLVEHCAARVVAVSNSAERAYAERGWAKEGQLVRIYNGIDVVAAAGEGGAVRRELGLAEEDLVVGMVSSLRSEKGHDVALSALNMLRTHFPNVRLLIVGQGGNRKDIARLAADLGDAVVMSGLRYDVMRCLDACDVCLHPSRADAFPTTLIEAMAASVPILATAVGGIPEMVTGGETAILVPAPPSADEVASALAALLRDPGRRGALAAAARRRYEQRFNAASWVRETRSLYEAVLAEVRGRRRGRLGHRRLGLQSAGRSAR